VLTAGETAVGGDRTFAGSLGTQVVKVFQLAVARTGLRDSEAAEAGLDPLTVGSVQDDHKAYYPGAHQLQLRITATRPAGSCWAPSWSAATPPRSPNASTSPPGPCSTT